MALPTFDEVVNKKKKSGLPTFDEVLNKDVPKVEKQYGYSQVDRSEEKPYRPVEANQKRETVLRGAKDTDVPLTKKQQKEVAKQLNKELRAGFNQPKVYQVMNRISEGLMEAGNAVGLGIPDAITGNTIANRPDYEKTAAGTTGKVVGEIAGFGKAYKLTKGLAELAIKKGAGRAVERELATQGIHSPRIAEEFIKGGIAESAFGTAKELADVAFDTRQNGNESIVDRAKNVATATAWGAVGDAGLMGIGGIGKQVMGKKPLPTFEEVIEQPVQHEVSATIDPVIAVEQPKVTRSADLRAETAATNETATRGIRANFANQVNNGNLSDDLTQKIKDTDQTYEVKTNQSSVDAADEALKDMSTATSKFLNNEAGGAEHIATGIKLMKQLDALGKHEEALTVSRKLAADLTTSGQTSQAASIMSRLSPEGQLLNLVRTAEKNGKTVTVEDSIKFKELAAKVQEKDGAGIRENQFNDILNRMEKGENVSVDDIKNLSDYLSGAEKSVKPKVIKEIVDDLPVELNDVKKREKIVSYMGDARQEALARIAARKGKMNSMALPNLAEWADHTIVVAADIIEGTVKAATHVEDLVKLFGEEIRPFASEVFRKAQSLSKGVSGSVSEGDVLKANQAFKRISGQEKGTLQENIVEKYLKENPKVSPKDIETLRKLAKNVTKLEGAEKIDADIAMQRILNSYEKSGAWDKVQSLRYMGMLLNTSTQAVNAISGPIMATTGYVADTFGAMVDVAMSATLKTPRSTTLYGSNPLRFIGGYLKHIKTGARAGWHGVNPSGIQSTNEIRGLAFKSKYNPLSWAERTLGAVSKGADYATYRTVYDSEISKQGYLSAKKAGLKGKDINNYVREFVNDPPEEAILQADRIGKNTTFQRSDTTGGKVANYLNSAPTLVKPAVNAVVPFVRTPINMASSAVTLTPAGVIKGLYQLTSKSDASRREAIRTLSLGVTGTGIGVLGYHLMDIGIITGGNDSGDKNVDNIREQAGKGKYRFNQTALVRYLGAIVNGEGFEAAEKAAEYQKDDHQFDYNKLQPLAFPLAAGASLAENKDKKLVGQVAKAGEDSFGSFFGMSTLKGVQNVFQPSYGGTQGEKSLGVLNRVGESFLKSFSWGGLAQEARRQDPVQRNTPFNDGIVANTKGYFQSRIPGQSQKLPARKTTLGQDYKNAEGFTGSYLNPYRSEVAPYNEAAQIIAGLIERTGDMKLAPTPPEKSVSGSVRGERVTIKIPADRYEQLQEDIGDEIIKRILELPKLDDDRMAEKIEDIYTDVRRKKMNEIKRENRMKMSR